MKIGIPKEIKNREYRVAITPFLVMELISHQHQVYIESQAGIGSGFNDQDYLDAGAVIVDTATAWNQEMIIKVKEPQPSEYKYLRPNLILFTFLHLAAEKELTKKLLANNVTSLAYELSSTILRPMSEIAGKRAILLASSFLEKHNDGQGLLLSNIPGLAKPCVVIIGGGTAGLSACKVALGLKTDVYILEIDENRIRYLHDTLQGQAHVLKSNHYNLQQILPLADVVISTILIPGALAKKIITTDLVKMMKPKSIIIDIAIDQGGTVETITKPTTHDAPTFVKYDVIHYAVANIPGAVAKTATIALTNATAKYILQVANKGWKQACLDDAILKSTISTYQGKVTCQPVAVALDMEYHAIDNLWNN